MIAERLLEQLSKMSVTWYRGGEGFEPTLADVRAVLDGAKQVLTNAPDNTEYDQASILVRKEEGDMNVYLHMGEL